MTDLALPHVWPSHYLSLWRGVRFRWQSPSQITEEFAAERGLSVWDLLSRERSYAIAHPRQDLSLRLHLSGFSTVTIGRFLDQDHTTVLHSIRQARKRLGE